MQQRRTRLFGSGYGAGLCFPVKRERASVPSKAARATIAKSEAFPTSALAVDFIVVHAKQRDEQFQLSPYTGTTAPCTTLASSLHKNKLTCAISCGFGH